MIANSWQVGAEGACCATLCIKATEVGMRNLRQHSFTFEWTKRPTLAAVFPSITC
jgi:hypothetical protein